MRSHFIPLFKKLPRLIVFIAVAMLLHSRAFAVNPLADTTVSKKQETAIVKMQSGNTFRGQIERQTSDSLSLRIEDGVLVVLPRSSITSIRYSSQSHLDEYPELGLVLGTPALLNLVIGYHWDWIGLRLSGAYLGNVQGFQMGIPFTFYHTETWSHAVAIVGATSKLLYYENDFLGKSLITHTFTGGGAAYELNVSGLSLELGAIFGSGTYHSPQPIFQIGYVHQFR